VPDNLFLDVGTALRISSTRYSRGRSRDLPVERPTKIRLAVNLKTAAAFGIKLPDTLLTMADVVVE
jgi:hypothetical protein